MVRRTGTVHQDVDAPKRLQGAVTDGLHGSSIPEVAADDDGLSARASDGLRDRFGTVFIAAMNDDAGAFGGERDSDRGSNAAG